MTPSDAAAALARAAAFDRRTVGEVEARAWAAALPADYRLDEVVEAIVSHYGASTDFLMPAHITALVSAKRTAYAKTVGAEIQAACPYCRGDGWRDADPTVRCDHRPAHGLDNTPKQIVDRPMDLLVTAAAKQHAIPGASS